MSQPLYFLPFLSLFFPLFFFFFFIKSNGTEFGTASPSCPSYVCNGFTVGYPFWWKDNTASTQYCGYQGFGVNCPTSGDPILLLPNDDYYVKAIDYKNLTLSLVDIDVVGGNCPRARRNITVGTLPLSFSQSDLNLTFHFNCTSVPSLPFVTHLPCLGSGSRQSFVYVEGTETEDMDWSEYNCDETVVATVKDIAINNYNSLLSQFGGAMEEGFVLDWRQAIQCGTCEDSDGRCGYRNETEFICICSDGTTRRKHCRENKVNLGLRFGIGFGAAGLSIIVMCLIFFIYYRKNKIRFVGVSYTSRNISSYPSSITDLEKAGTYLGVHIFKYSELEKATHYFDSKNELGNGGFGTVYKGKLQDGRVVAVKRLFENNYKRVEQFMNEIEILTLLRHTNLVSLYGCTSHQCRELLLVYEYISNGTVADHLHGERATPGSLTWTTRMSIAIETASALAYLHASDVIHRDVKTNNILLDNNFCVKVADFGLSRLFPTDVTHVSTAPQGTPGYVDPEYHECYQLTNKSDVFSFGVVLIELISSKPAVDITRHRHEINLSNMAINKIRTDALHELVDPCLGFESDYKVRKMINAVAELAFQCLQNGKEMRPSMDEVLKVLEGIQSEDYNQEKKDLDIPADDDVLLKNYAKSPDSVVVAWASLSTTPNSSG